ncbi:MAG: GNAT family N-acetyltransferase [Hyphomicrobiaceae bacterium]
MIQIDSYRPSDRAVLIEFVEAIQEHERIDVSDLKPGPEIGQLYAEILLRRVAEHNGCILLARTETRTVGFACAWIEEDDDPLLRDEMRAHAYISDIYITEDWRRKGVATKLLNALEEDMRRRGCARIRVCAKAANRIAVDCYRRSGYRTYEIIFSKSLQG